MTKAIFVSYRRGDSAGYTGWLCEKLLQHWSHDQVFIDINGISLGDNFRERIKAAVESCDVLIPVIGRGWLTAQDARGKLRLGRSNDFVTIEIATALERDIFVMPVLVDGASMPDEEDLPEVLKKLACIHAISLRHESFNRDAQILIQALHERIPVVVSTTISPNLPTAEPLSGPIVSEILDEPLHNLDKVKNKLPPVKFANDPQHERFGGKSKINGRNLIASVRPSRKGDKWCVVTLSVQVEPGFTPLIGDHVYFFVHNTFDPDEFAILVNGQGEAVLQLVAWGAFTVGVVADNGATMLELDLADPKLVTAPTDWQAR